MRKHIRIAQPTSPSNIAIQRLEKKQADTPLPTEAQQPTPGAAPDPRYAHDFAQVRVNAEEKTTTSDQPLVVLARVGRMSEQEIDKAPHEQRALMIERLYDGEPKEPEMLAILRIVEESKQDHELVKVLDKADAREITRAFDDDERKKLRKVLRERYYPRAEQKSMIELLRRCLDGERDEHVEELIVDVLETRPDGRLLIDALGRAYTGPADGPDRDFKNGLYKLETSVEGARRSRLQQLFGISGLLT